MRKRAAASILVVVSLVASSGASIARADGDPEVPAPAASSSASASAAAPPTTPEIVKVLTPGPVAAPPEKVRFNADPVGDGAVLAFGVGFGVLSTLLISTGEIHPQAVNPHQKFLAIDTFAVDQTPDHKAATYSNIVLYGAVAFAVVDPILDGLRERDGRATLVDAVLYAEVLTVNLSATNLAKMAVRRPRPYAYINAQARARAGLPPIDDTSTDSSLSFFSGHASTVAAVSGCATYLAFARAPNTFRPWVTLGAGALLTTFVSVERVRVGDHFPTDVIAGAFIGGGIGLLIPYLHRADAIGQRPIWVGYSPDPKAGGLLTVSGLL